MPDQLSCAAEESADNTASRILQMIASVLGKKREGTDPPASKQQMLEKAIDTYNIRVAGATSLWTGRIRVQV